MEERADSAHATRVGACVHGAAEPTTSYLLGGTPARSLRAVLAVGSVGAGLVALKVTTGWGVVCPFRAITGWRCPLCGSTTLGVALAHGDLWAAWRSNQVVFVGLLMLAMGCLIWGVQLIWARRCPGGATPGAVRLGRIRQRHAYLVCLVLGVVWTLVRNLVPAMAAAA